MWHRDRALLAALTLALPAACVGSLRGPAAQSAPGLTPLPELVRVKTMDRGRPLIRAVPLEEYVQAAAISEFAPPAGESSLVERMFEVQTVLARTYAAAYAGRHGAEGFDLCATTHCQLYEPARLGSSRWAPHAGRASRRTAGRTLRYGELPARALFHADCGGHTSDPAAVWGGLALPYLRAIPDDGAAQESHAEWQYEAPVAVLLRIFNADARTAIGQRLDRIEVRARDRAGRAITIAVEGTRPATVRGEDLRQILNRSFGARAIRSTRFDVRRTATTFAFTGRGFGHGVGLCQAGALARLRRGTSVTDVLGYYFPGTRLE